MANPFNDNDFATAGEQIGALKMALSEALTMIRTVRNSAGDLLDDLNDLIGEVEADARLTEAMIPDDYRSLVSKMEQVSIDWNISGDLLNQRQASKDWLFVGPGGDQIEVTATTHDSACAELVSKLGYGVNEDDEADDRDIVASTGEYRTDW